MTRPTGNTIAIFASHMPVGGVPRMIVNISRGLCDAGYRVDLVLYKKEGPFLEQLDPRVNVINLNSILPPVVIWRLAMYLRVSNPRTLLATGLHRNVGACAARLISGWRGRLVLSERVIVSLFWTNRHPMWLQRLFKWGYRLCGFLLFRTADAIHSVSEEVRDDLIRIMRLPPEKMHVIYNPFINATLLAQKDAPVDHPWLQNKTLRVILSVGRLHPQKDYPTLLHAFAGLVKTHPHARLLILGDGHEREPLTQLIQSLGIEHQAELKGFVANPYAYMSKCAIFVLSSAYEGCANALAEALGCGAAVISTNCPGGTRDILENGRYGTITPVGDAPALEKAMRDLLNHPQPGQQRTAAFLAEKAPRFSYDASVREYLDLLTASS